METVWWMWAAFFAVITTLLVLDLGVLHRRQHAIGPRESLLTCGAYMIIALLFGAGIWHQLGWDKASLFLTGYLVELSLSMDNIFVISLVLAYFSVPKENQYRVLFWGILGVIVLRGIMIFLGTEIVKHFSAVLYFFAAFLVFTGAKMLVVKEDHETDISQNPVVRFMRKHMRTTTELHGSAFLVRQKDPETGHIKLFITPLFLALIVVECVDLIFAIDSIPAILSLTTDPFIVYTSNIFAILGLRALYFALSFILDRFAYMQYAMALVLIFIGSKVFVVKLFDIEHFPASISLGVTVSLLLGGILFSWYRSSASGSKSV